MGSEPWNRKKRSMSNSARVTNTRDETRRERQQPAPFFSAAQTRKLSYQYLVSLSGSLRWAEGAPKCHPRNSDGGAAIRVLRVSSAFWVNRSVLVLFARSSWLKNWGCDRHGFFWGAIAGVRCAMVCKRGRDWCLGRHSLRFTIYRISRGRRKTSNSRRIASRALAQGEHATSSCTNSNWIQSNPIFSKIKYFVLDFVNRIEWNSLDPRRECLLGCSFFDRSQSNSLQPKSESWMGFNSFFFVNTGPKAEKKEKKHTHTTKSHS